MVTIARLTTALVVDSSPIAANGEERPKPNKVTLPHQPSRLARNLSMQTTWCTNTLVGNYNNWNIQKYELNYPSQTLLQQTSAALEMLVLVF